MTEQRITTTTTVSESDTIRVIGHFRLPGDTVEVAFAERVIYSGVSIAEAQNVFSEVRSEPRYGCTDITIEHRVGGPADLREGWIANPDQRWNYSWSHQHEADRKAGHFNVGYYRDMLNDQFDRKEISAEEAERLYQEFRTAQQQEQ